MRPGVVWVVTVDDCDMEWCLFSALSLADARAVAAVIGEPVFLIDSETDEVVS